MQNVIVIGGGISGLSFAYRCAAGGSGALVLEASPRLGGCLHSHRLETGFWFELGAHTCYNSYGGLIEMIEACGLIEQLLPRAKVPFRLLRDERLRSIPSELNFFAILASLPRLFFANKEEESVERYYTRIVGAKNYRRVLGPMLAAVPSQEAGEFPATMLFKKRPRRKDILRSFTLQGGLQSVTDALAQQSGIESETGVTVQSVTRIAGGFCVQAEDGRRFEARQVAIAVPPPMAAKILATDFPELSAELGRIATSTVNTVGIVVAKEKLELEPVAGIVGIDDCFYSAVSRDTVPDERFRSFSFHFRPGTSPAKRMERITQVLGVAESDLENSIERQTVLPSPREGHASLAAAIDEHTAGTELSILGNFFAGLAIEDCITRSFAEFTRLQK
jgi:oxygen-dependent protoporphyrinogen oxidase